MKKRILLFSGSLFHKTFYSNNMKFYKSKKNLIKLLDKYDIDTFSNDKMTSEFALNVTKEFITKRAYDKCIISLGEADIKYSNPEIFERNLNEILKLLKDYEIEPIIMSLPKELLRLEEAFAYQQIIHDLAIKNEFYYIHNDETSIEGSHSASTDFKIKRTIMDIIK